MNPSRRHLPGLAALLGMIGALAALFGMIGALAGCGRETPHPKRRWTRAEGEAPATRFASRVHLPYPHLGMNTAGRDLQGRPARIRCATCHHLIKPREANAMAKSLERFHQGVRLVHGGQTCRTCHQPPLFESFRLSSGEVIPYARAIDLCGQCHSRQRQDYDHGAHGGMTGHWDLDSGPRDRNSCLDCHNPHRPRIGQIQPAPRPRYRFLED